MRLTSIRLSPAPPTTRTRFLDGLLAPFMGDTGLPDWMHPTPRSPQTLHEILLSTKALVAHIDKVDVFDMERVGIRLEPAPSGEPDEVELVLALRERGRYFLKAGTEMGSNEGGGVSTPRGWLTAEYHRQDTECLWRRRDARSERERRHQDTISVPGYSGHTRLLLPISLLRGQWVLPGPRQHCVCVPPRTAAGCKAQTRCCITIRRS